MTHNDRRFSGGIERLRSEQRLALLEVPDVVQYTLDGISLQSVLDVGTGSGIFAEAFANSGLTVKGVDIRKDMLEAARQFVPSGEFKQGKMEAIPFPDQSVELVFMGLVLHESDDLKVALAEAYRIGTKRTSILEWIYSVEEPGPPLHHRLKSVDVVVAAEEVGFKTITQMNLTHLILYRLDV